MTSAPHNSYVCDALRLFFDEGTVIRIARFLQVVVVAGSATVLFYTLYILLFYTGR